LLSAPDNKVLAGQRILIAEDEGLIALELETALSDLGCDVVGPVSRIDEVLRYVEAGAVDGALLDVNLRGERVFSILPQLIARALPIIITSGYDDATLFPEPFRSLPRIAKPFNDNALREVCLRTFGKR
jgi:two-component SAPR family response regulator